MRVLFLIWTLCVYSFLAPLQAVPVEMAKGVLIRDAEVEDILRTFLDPLFEKADLDPKSIKVFLISDSTINAFAAPGPMIVVNTGLITKCKTPEELISVLAHETGHVKARHILGRLSVMNQAGGVYLASMGLGALLSLLMLNPVPLLVGSAVGQSVAMDTFLSFSRDQEMQADLISFSLLGKLKWPTQGTVSFFKRIEALAGTIYNPSQPVYTQTHPAPPERIKMAEAAYEPSHHLPTIFQWLFQKLQVKILAYQGKPQNVLKMSLVKASPYRAYAEAIVYYRQGRLKDAAQILRRLSDESPADPYLWEMRAQLAFEQGDFQLASQAMKKALALMKRKHASLYILGARIALQNKNDQKAERLLRQAVQLEAYSPDPWYYLSIIASKRRQHGKAQVYLVERSLRAGSLKEAKMHLATAKKLIKKTDPFYVHVRDLDGVIAHFPQNN